MTMFIIIFKLVVVYMLLGLMGSSTADSIPGFVYNGFNRGDQNLSLVGADITPDGLLRLTNTSSMYQIGQAFYIHPFQFKMNDSNISSSSAAEKNSGNTITNTPNNTTVFSFSTTFIFAIISEYRLSGQGITFVLAPQKGFPEAKASIWLGLLNESTNGKYTNHVVAVELDTIKNAEVDDINDNHVGIDINDLKSVKSTPAGYYTSENGGGLKNLSLISGEPVQVWVEYDGVKKQLDVTISPFNKAKPDFPLLSLSKDLSADILDSMYVGFTSSTGSILTSHYLLGWSFKINGDAQLNLSQLPKPSRRWPAEKSKIFGIALPIVVPIFVLTTVFGIALVITRNRKFAEVVEEWELNISGKHRFSYKDLYKATNGFREKELLGIGGFGRVYKGVLPNSKIDVAVKRISHNSKQGIREFIAEIVSIGHLRHRNLVQLLGYCRRNGELLLVYDFMPNGSLDRFLFRRSNSSSSSMLNWKQRFQIIKGVASALVYLHQEWEQVVIHRDIKASNVLLDAEMNSRLGDFGLARLYDRGSNPQTTSVVGTLGYLAPELTKTGRSTTSTDVFAFEAFLLEVACGRRPIELQNPETENLVDWVLFCWCNGAILQTSDPNLGGEYIVEEMEMVLKLGLLCSHNLPKARSTMRQVVQYLEGDVPLPQTELWDLEMSDGIVNPTLMERSQDVSMSYPLTGSSSTAESVLSGPR